MAAPATDARPDAPAHKAGNPYELASERQAPNKEGPGGLSAYAAERACPYPQARDRITPYEEVLAGGYP